MAKAQMDNRVFEEKYRVPDSLRYGVKAHTFSFFRNLEYFTPAADGKTLFGQQLTVRGLLHPTERLTVSGGIYLWKDFGNAQLQAVRPVFTLRYGVGNFSFLFGTLEGQLAHRQIEPLQDFEAVITHQQEDGFQFKYDGPKFWGDVWIEWQNMIYRYEKSQEKLQVGLHLRPVITEGSAGRLLGIVQGRAHHQGGQLDTTVSKAPLTTFWALSPGLRWEEIPVGGSRFMGDGYYVRTQGITQTYPEAIRQGNGVYANLQWAHPKLLSVMVSYWNGTGVYVPGGGAYYSSLASEVGASARGEVLKHRELMILRFMRDFDLGSGCKLTLRAEPIYDLSRSHFDYNYQLYLNYQPGWSWGKR